MSDIANSLTTIASGKVLDARQGKALSDSLKTVSNNVDSLLESGIVAIDFTSATIFITHGAQYLAKTGKIVYLHICFSINISINNGDAFFAIPAGYKPVKNESNIATMSNNGDIVTFGIEKNGTVYANGSWPVGKYEINHCYVMA